MDVGSRECRVVRAQGVQSCSIHARASLPPMLEMFWHQQG